MTTMNPYEKQKADERKLVQDTISTVQSALGAEMSNGGHCRVDGIDVKISTTMAGYGDRRLLAKVSTTVGESRTVTHAWAKGDGLEKIVASIRARVVIEIERRRKSQEDSDVRDAIVARYRLVNERSGAKRFSFNTALWGRTLGKLEISDIDASALTDEQKTQLLRDLEEVITRFLNGSRYGV